LIVGHTHTLIVSVQISMRTSLELQPSALALAIADVVAASVRDRLGGDRQIENEGPAPIGMDKQAEGRATAAPSAMNIDLIIDQWKRNDRLLGCVQGFCLGFTCAV
jgi:hypothetical protein